MAYSFPTTANFNLTPYSIGNSGQSLMQATGDPKQFPYVQYNEGDDSISGLAMDRMNQSVFNVLAPAYAQGYENSQNRGLQSGQAAMQGLLGWWGN